MKLPFKLLNIAKHSYFSFVILNRGIGPDQPYFVQAREKMAQIYLKHLKVTLYFYLSKGT